MSYIPIQKDAIPYKFEIELADEIFEFEVNYNADHDFFTVNLYKNKEVLCYGAKVVYGSPLFRPYEDDRFPEVNITPLDESGQETRVTYENLGERVFLFVSDDDVV